MPRIAIIIPFFGQVPVYMGYFIESMRGRCFDVLFFSDLDLSEFKLPNNFKLHRMTFDEFRSLVRERIDPEAVVCDTRKICDYKPMFAKIFEINLQGYDYWGIGDCDLVYGRQMDVVLTEFMRNAYDVISFRRNWLSGGFALFKNNARMRDLYLSSDNWKEMIRLPHMCWDECCGGEFFPDLSSGAITPNDCRRLKCDSFSAVIWRADGLRFYHEDIICESSLAHEKVTMNGDDLRLNGVEIPIFHFIGAKMRRYWRYMPWSPTIGNRYLITDTGFYYGNHFNTKCRIVHAYRKASAFLASLRSNGVSHWMWRLKSFIS